MKLKQRPEDFQVEEVTDRAPQNEGAFAFYRLRKRGWDTLDAFQAVRRRWRIESRQLSYGGLKDRHAETVQHFTIFHGPKRDLAHHDVAVEYLGQTGAPYSSRDILANRFCITLRELRQEEVGPALEALEEVRAQGVPNYFDDQRFGSVPETGQFVAKAMILGGYEEALRVALAAPYAHDRARQKKDKAVLSAHWGDWRFCKSHLSRGHARSLVDYLVSHPGDFRGALARMRPDLMVMYLSAYQSYLWNKILDQYLRRLCRPDQIVPARLRAGEMPMYRRLTDAQFAALQLMQLPLPSARLKLEDSDHLKGLVEGSLGQDGIQLSDLKLRAFRRPFFAKGERAALCRPKALESEISSDERHPGQSKLVMRFDLPRGSYATLLVKRVQAETARRTVD
jgi:tRNA pseudouridine13 synthase